MSLEGQKRESSIFELMSGPTSCGRAAARGYVRGMPETDLMAVQQKNYSITLVGATENRDGHTGPSLGRPTDSWVHS